MSFENFPHRLLNSSDVDSFFWSRFLVKSYTKHIVCTPTNKELNVAKIRLSTSVIDILDVEREWEVDDNVDMNERMYSIIMTFKASDFALLSSRHQDYVL